MNIFIRVDDGLLFGPIIEVLRGRMERLDDQIFFLRGYSVEANPKCIRDVIAVLGLEDARPVARPIVKRTTTESLVELENEKRAVQRTAVENLLYMCQERADIMYSVSDEIYVKHVARYLKDVPSAKCLIDINRFPTFVNVYTDSDWEGQHLTCKSTSGGVTQWRSTTLSACSRTQMSVSLSAPEAELCARATQIAEGIVTKHVLKELRH